MKLKDFLKFLNDEAAANPEMLDRDISFRMSCFFSNPNGADTYGLEASPDADELSVSENNKTGVLIRVGCGTDRDNWD